MGDRRIINYQLWPLNCYSIYTIPWYQFIFLIHFNIGSWIANRSPYFITLYHCSFKSVVITKQVVGSVCIGMQQSFSYLGGAYYNIIHYLFRNFFYSKTKLAAISFQQMVITFSGFSKFVVVTNN